MILGGYEIGPEIGSGAMGSVHLAYEKKTGASVALKRIHAKYADQKQTLRRFAIEVQTAARLRHPNIVSVIASGTESRGTPYCVMEWVSGSPLGQWTDGELPWSRVAWIASDLLDALAYAHARGVVHRDLKPANLLVENPYTDQARVRLVDFGIARLLEPEGDDPEATRLTMDDRVLGTPAYLSPEQAQGLHHLIGPHTDLYALGVILYELVAGRLPFGDMPVINLLMAHASKPAPPLDLSDRQDVPKQVAQVVERLLKKQPEERYESAQLVRDALELSREMTRRPLPRCDDEDDLTINATLPTLIDGDATPQPRSTIQVSMNVQGKPEALQLVGRQKEMDALLELARRTRANRRSSLVFIHGEAGVGKSRLVQEARYELEESGQYRGARLLGRGGVSEDEAVRALLARLLYVERLTEEPLRRRLELAARHYELDALDARALTAWFERDSADGPKPAEMLDVVTRVIRAIAVSRPLALVVEGIDSEGSSFTLEILSRLLIRGDRTMWDRSLLFVMAPIRLPPAELSEPSESFYKAIRQQDRVDELQLEPLPPEVLVEMVQGLVTSGAEKIAARARGNPLFALELARYKEGALEATMADIASTLPVSIGDIWQRRIRDVTRRAEAPEVCRGLLMAAAILGPSVRRRHLVSVVREALSASKDAVEGALDDWVRAEVLSDDGAREPTISFVHTLGYEYVAERIEADSPETSALLLHITDWIITNRAGMEPDMLLRLAKMLDGQSETSRAASVRLLAGEICVGHLEYPRAEKIFGGLAETARTAGDDQLVMRVVAELANLKILQGDVEAASSYLAELGPEPQVGEESEIEAVEASALVNLIRAKANLDVVTGRPSKAVARLHRAVELARRSDDPLGLAAVRTQLSQALERCGEMSDAERQCRLAIKSLKQSEAAKRLLSHANISLASLCRRQGRIDEAGEAANAAKTLADSVGDRQQLDRALEALGCLADDRGDPDRAISLVERVADRQRTFGDLLGVARTTNMLGIYQRHRGDLASSESLHRDALKQLEQIPDPQLFAANVVNLGVVFRRRGDLTQAEEHFRRAIDVYREVKDAQSLANAGIELALVFRKKERLDQSEALCRDGLRQLLDFFDYAGAAHAQLVLGLLASDRGNWSIARELFSEARSAFTDMGIHRNIVSAEVWLARAELEQGQRQQAEMAGRRLEERLRERPVFKRMLSQGLRRLAEGVASSDQEIAWRLEDRARLIEDRLERA